MDIDLFISGVGGQGIQLLSKTLALAAMSEGKMVMLSSEYGSEMRGGSSRATLVVGSGARDALPVLSSAGYAIALHHLFWEQTAARLRPGALVLADSMVAGQLPAIDADLKAVPSTQIAVEAGNSLASSLAMAGAFAVLTRLASTEALVAAMRELVPAYRSQHIETNERAIRGGAKAGAALRVSVPI